MARTKRLSVINKAVVVRETSKNAWIDQPCGAEPATVEVDVGYGAFSGDTDVLDFDCVGGNSVWHGGGLALKYIYAPL